MTETPSTPATTSWRLLLLSLLKPGTYMRLTEESPSGPAHFYRTFGLYCLLPVVVLNLLAIVARGLAPDAWYFQDINPWTIVIAAPAQLLIGPLNIWILAWCMYGGMAVVGLKPAQAKERVLKTGWYVGTTLHCLAYWWLGFGIFFSSIRVIHRAVEPLLTLTLLLALAVWIRVALAAYRVNLAELTGGSFVRTFGGLVVGAVLFMIAMIPVGLVVKSILYALL